MADRPLNYTTKIPAKQSVGECSDLLAAAGAERVAVVYEDRKPVGLSFRLKMPSGMQDFTMPVNVTAMHAVLVKERKPGGSIHALHLSRAQLDKYASQQHAEMVAWRVIKDWLEAQLALIAAEMATLDQVMLPYLQVDSGSLYELVQERGRIASLEAGRG